jgi:hypothetical protein
MSDNFNLRQFLTEGKLHEAYEPSAQCQRIESLLTKNFDRFRANFGDIPTLEMVAKSFALKLDNLKLDFSKTDDETILDNFEAFLMFNVIINPNDPRYTEEEEE